jgi:hypothetical protein
MSRTHGKDTFVSVGGADLSEFTDNSEFKRSRDSHDTTGYGKQDHVFKKGLKGGTFTMSGTYDSTAGTGPRAVLNGEFDNDDNVEIIRRPEGTGSGKPQDRFEALLENYTETNPVADMVKWSADFKISDAVDDTAQ